MEKLSKLTKPKKRYFNYVAFAAKLQAMSHDELQAELELRSVALRMCEQELRQRRANAKRTIQAAAKPSQANERAS